MKILITGDSFAADWQIKYPDKIGWPNILNQDFDVTNVAQAGCSEFRIYQQLIHQDIEKYDAVIISHTSPYRIYTDYNPAHEDDMLHHHCDLLYSDVESLAKKYIDYESVKTYFTKFFSLEYAEFCYSLIRKEISMHIGSWPTIEICHMPIIGPVDVDFREEFLSNPGDINHYNTTGNANVAKILNEKLINLCRI